MKKDREKPVEFICCRGFEYDAEGNIIDFRAQLEHLSGDLQLGKGIWLYMKAMGARNWADLFKYCGENGYTIFNISGYVPGNKASDEQWYLQGFGEFTITPEKHQEILELLDGRFLGFDIGEQDTRYLMTFAQHGQMMTLDRHKQYLHHYDFFARMRRDLCNDYSVLVGSSNVHYLAKEKGCKMIGAEALQIHPNINVWHTFIRGAAKQYDIPWFGAVSVFNAFGYRVDKETTVDDFGMECGRHSGPSDSMLRRAFHVLYEYGAHLLGFEHFVTENGKLTVIGQIQREVMEMATTPRQMLTPVAIYLDFFQGWQAPRNSVNYATHRVWGELPYDENDFRVDALFELLYPHYSDGANFRDERGFLVNTPYGDICDVLLSDADEAVLHDYQLIIIPGKIALDVEQITKLTRYMDQGGRIIYGGASSWEHANLIVVRDWLESTGQGTFGNCYEQTIDSPYRLTAQCRKILDGELKKVLPVAIDGSVMSVATKDCLFLVNNNPTPETITIPALKFSGTIEAGDFIRLPFEGKVPEARERRKTKRQYVLALHEGNWREWLMDVPGFGNYFAGITIDAEQLLRLSDGEIARQAEFFDSRGIEVVGCNMSNMFNHYPGLSMIDTGNATSSQAAEVVMQVIKKMEILACKNLIVATQKNSELVTSEAEALKRIGVFLRNIPTGDIQLHIAVLPHRYGEGLQAMQELLAQWDLSCRFKIYADTGALLCCRDQSESIKHGYPKSDGEPRNCFPKNYPLITETKDRGSLTEILADYQGSLLGISAPYCDFARRIVNAHLPIADSIYCAEITQAIECVKIDTTLVLDFDTTNWDEIFTSYQTIENLS